MEHQRNSRATKKIHFNTGYCSSDKKKIKTLNQKYFVPWESCIKCVCKLPGITGSGSSWRKNLRRLIAEGTSASLTRSTSSPLSYRCRSHSTVSAFPLTWKSPSCSRPPELERHCGNKLLVYHVQIYEKILIVRYTQFTYSVNYFLDNSFARLPAVFFPANTLLWPANNTIIR